MFLSYIMAWSTDISITLAVVIIYIYASFPSLSGSPESGNYISTLRGVLEDGERQQSHGFGLSCTRDTQMSEEGREEWERKE